MDGMTLSFHKNQARVVHPWKPDMPSAAELQAGDLVPGALFRERVFVQSKQARDMLLRFTRVGKTTLPLLPVDEVKAHHLVLILISF